MDFYTKAWKKYIYSDWVEAMSKKYNISSIRYMYGDMFLYEGNYDENLKEAEFNKYYKLKEEYVSLESELKERFGKYEKVRLLSIDEERILYNEKIDKFIEKYKNEVLNTIDMLRECNIEVDLDINDIDFNLLALNKVNLRTIKFYQSMRRLYKKYLEDNGLLEEEDLDKLKKIDLVVNDVNSFLTSYSEYIEYKNNSFYKFINNKSFHDCKVLKYDVSDDKIIIEIEGQFNRGVRLIINNPKVVIFEKKDEGFVLLEDEFDLEVDDIIDVFSNDYECYEDIEYHLIMEYAVNIFNEKIRIDGFVRVEYIAESIIGEEFIIDESIEGYIKCNKLYQDNLKEIIDMIDEDVYNLLKKPYFNLLDECMIRSYSFDKDLLLDFKDFICKKQFSLKFINAKMKFINNGVIISREELLDIIKDRLGFDNILYPIKFRKDKDLILVDILVEEGTVVSVWCDMIELLDNNFNIDDNKIKILANGNDCEN